MGLFEDSKYVWNHKYGDGSMPVPTSTRKGVVEDIKDPTGNNRVRIRIAGVHTSDKNALPTNKLPWVDVKPAIGNGGGKGQTSNLQIGQMVDTMAKNVSETIFEVTGMSNIISELTKTDRTFGSVAEGDDKRIGKFLAPLLASGDKAKLAMTVFSTAMAGVVKYVSAWVPDGSGGLVLPPQNPPRNLGDGLDEQMTNKARDIDLSNQAAFYVNPANDTFIDVQQILDFILPGSPPGTTESVTAEGLPDPYDKNSLVPPGQSQIGPRGVKAEDYILNIFSNQKYLTTVIWKSGYTPPDPGGGPGGPGDGTYVPDGPNWDKATCNAHGYFFCPIENACLNVDIDFKGQNAEDIEEVKRAEIKDGKLFIPKDAKKGIYHFVMTLKRKYGSMQKLSFVLSIRVGGASDTFVHISEEREPDYDQYPKNQSALRYTVPIPYDQLSRPGSPLMAGNPSLYSTADYGSWPSADDEVREINIMEPELTNEKAQAWYCDVKDNGRVSIVNDATKGNETYAIYHATEPSGGDGQGPASVSQNKENPGPSTMSSSPNDKKERPDVSRFEFNPKGELIQKSTGDMFLVSSENLNMIVDNIVQQKVKQLWTLHCPVVQIKGDVRIEGRLIVTENAEFKQDVNATGEVRANAEAAATTLSQHVHPSDGTPPTPGS